MPHPTVEERTELGRSLRSATPTLRARRVGARAPADPTRWR